jgi:hypothetical protein
MLRLEIKEPFVLKIVGIMKKTGVNEFKYHLPVKLMNLQISISENRKVKNTRNQFIFVDKSDQKAYLVKKV